MVERDVTSVIRIGLHRQLTSLGFCVVTAVEDSKKTAITIADWKSLVGGSDWRHLASYHSVSIRQRAIRVLVNTFLNRQLK